jgi:hypothetical protein
MSRPARQYRSFEEFEREEILRPRGFVQTLDEFHEDLTVADEDIVELWDSVDEEEEDEDDDE